MESKNWVIRDNEILEGNFGEPFPAVVCKMIYNDGDNAQIKNARLISAAPELLEGLKMILDLSEKATPEARHGSFLGDIGRIAESLIYKAENKGK